MKITLKLLKDWRACYRRLQWFKQKYKGRSVDHIDVMHDLIMSTCYSPNADCGWLLEKVLESNKAERNYIHLFNIYSTTNFYFWTEEGLADGYLDSESPYTLMDADLKAAGFNDTEASLERWVKKEMSL